MILDFAFERVLVFFFLISIFFVSSEIATRFQATQENIGGRLPSAVFCLFNVSPFQKLTNHIQNIALYSTFAVVGFFAGTIVNRLGVRLALSFGGIGYTIYSISLLVSEHKYVPGFNIFAGAFLGVCAGLLWAAQGTIMMSYPAEHQKGRYFAWFWAIFNIGCLLYTSDAADEMD